MFQVPAILTGFSTRQDGGASIRFATNEISDEEFLVLKKFQGTFGFVLFKENAFKEEEVPKEDAEDKNKTPSKRLRACIFILWQQEGSKGTFDAYYREKMEKLIEWVKGKLD